MKSMKPLASARIKSNHSSASALQDRPALRTFIPTSRPRDDAAGRLISTVSKPATNCRIARRQLITDYNYCTPHRNSLAGTLMYNVSCNFGKCPSNIFF